MPKWSLTNNGNVVQCKWNCKCNHEHYVGSYEMAVKYFDVDPEEIESYGKLINIIIYHQTSQYVIPKLSNELFDILMMAMAEHKYWIPENNRKNEAFKTLDLALKSGLIMDYKICKTIECNKNNIKAQKRKYMYDLWIKQNLDEEFVINLLNKS